MIKERSRALANYKLLIVLPLIAIVMIAFSSCKGKTKPAESTTTEIAPPPPPPPPAPVITDQKVVAGENIPANAPPPPPPPTPFTVQNGDTTWRLVDKMPEFPGGEAALLKYIANHTDYPAVAEQKGIQGKVFISFVVSKDCKISNAKVAGSSVESPELTAEALRVVNALPAFEKPGLKNGKPVSVQYMVPIVFKLN